MAKKPDSKKTHAPPTLPDDPLATIRGRLGAGGSIERRKKQAADYATIAFEDEDEKIEVHVPTLEASAVQRFHSIAEVRTAMSGGSAASAVPATNHWDSQSRSEVFSFTDQKSGAVVAGTVTMRSRSLSPSANGGLRTAMVWMEVSGTIRLGKGSPTAFEWRSSSNIVELEEDVSEEQYLQDKIGEAVELAVSGARDRVGSVAGNARITKESLKARAGAVRAVKSKAASAAKKAAAKRRDLRAAAGKWPKSRRTRRG